VEAAHGERDGLTDLPAKGSDQRNRPCRPEQLSRVNAPHRTRIGQGKCVALWCARAYNVMHFGAALPP
jgi:hypothetical protein